MESKFLTGLMATDDTLRDALRKMMAEGEINFNFEGRIGGQVVKWVRVEGRPTVVKSSGWEVAIRMGDGSEGTALFEGPDAESDILALVRVIAQSFREEAVTN